MKPDLVKHPRRRAWVWMGAALWSAGLACGLPSSNTPPPPVVEPTVRPTAAAPAPTGEATAGDLIFHNGVLLTMDESQPTASAIHIQGARIVSVGNDGSILAEAGPQTLVVDLGGRTLMPGFVDAHSHYFERKDVFPTADQAQEAALAQGITTTAEFYVDEALLGELQALEASGGLRLRLSVYLAWDTGCGDPLGSWYLGHPVDRTPGKKLWINGVKIYADGGSCNVPAVSFEYPGGYGQGDLYFSAPELESLIRELDAAGYQVAIHALGDRALDVVLKAYTDVLHGVNPHRHRIEHNGVLRPDQLPLYTQAGVVATLMGPFQTCVTLGDRSRFRYLVPEPQQTWEWPWRDLLDANPNVHFAWHGDMPIFTTDVFQHLYGFVTRNQVAEDGTICQAPDWLARNAITVDEALQFMTTGAAYALQRDAEVGSLTEGKFADLIILSANPQAIPSTELKDLKVLMTMVGGNVEYCAEGMDAVCPTAAASEPTTELTAAAPLASSVFRDDFEGALDPGWSWYQDDAPGWTLSNMPGWLRLNLSTGTFFGATPPANLLLRPAPSGDFELETWLRFSPYRNFESAGLVVVFDDHSVLQFGRGFCEVPSSGAGCIGDGLYFDNIQNNAAVGGNFATPSYLGVDYLLRLQRQGNSYVASFTPDNAPGGNLGSHTVEKSPVSIGLIAAQAETAGNYADFDYVELTAGP